MQETLGDIKANRIIWTLAILIPSSLIYCFSTTTWHDHLPSVVDIAKTYPNCIVFRIGMLYSMFLLFLQTLFIHWWISTAKEALGIRNGIISSFPLGLTAVISYAIFGSCIDTKRINYTLIKYSTTVAAISFTVLIQAINKNIKTIRQKDPHFVSHQSWRYKRILGTIELVLFVVAVLIYVGQISIGYKQILQYSMIAVVVLYFASFTLDFKKKYMGVQINQWSAQQQPQQIMSHTNNINTIRNPILNELNESREFHVENKNQQMQHQMWRQRGPVYPGMQ